MEQRRGLLLALALLLAIPVSENYELTSPQNVVGIVGQDTILPCTISSTKPLDNLQVQWGKITDGHTEDIYTHGQFGGEPMQKYLGRASVPGDGFATGNLSLTLKNVQPADEGMYRCIVTSRDWSADTATKLSIAGIGEVFIEILGPQGQGLELGCRSQGWLPKPTVQWVTEDGQGLFADTEIHQDSRKLFSVQSRVTVTGEQVGKVTCQILNSLLQVEKKTTVRISGAGFPRVSPFVPAFWTLLTLFLLTLAAGAVLVYRGRTVLANIRALESTCKEGLHEVSQQMQTLQKTFQNMEDSMQRDLRIIRANLEEEEESEEDENPLSDMRSMLLNLMQQHSQVLQTQQQALQNAQPSTQRDLRFLRADVENK